MLNLSSTEESYQPSAISFQPERCGRYWQIYLAMLRANAAAEDRTAGSRYRETAKDKRDELLRWLGTHIEECEQCRSWIKNLSSPQES